jgi:hypothetical protein
MKCPNCSKDSTAVYRCNNCGDVRCLKCKGNSGLSSAGTPGGYDKMHCYICKKQEVKKIS